LRNSQILTVTELNHVLTKLRLTNILLPEKWQQEVTEPSL